MQSTSGGTRPRSLADVALQDEVRIRDICFDVIREHCTQSGLHTGDTVRPVGGNGQQLVLRTATGARVMLDRFYACFVEVSPPGAQGPPAIPAYRPASSSARDARIEPRGDRQ